MKERYSDYLIIGAGLAGASAVDGIRAMDPKGSISLIGAEDAIPYDRPPLSKKLWLGKKKVEEIYLHPESFYRDNNVTLLLGRRIAAIDAGNKSAMDHTGERYRFGKMLLATGGTPRILSIPGGDLDGIFYYRTLHNYTRLREKTAQAKSATVLGGGFIGSEMAAALSANHLDVTMIYHADYLCDRVFPKDLGLAVEHTFESRNIHLLKKQTPTSIESRGRGFTVHTSTGQSIASDLVVAGIGIVPAVELAEQAGLATGNGIIVDEYLQTSNPAIYAAGDNARFPYLALGQSMRVEHWDNALNQGKLAGRNMAGAHDPYTYMPYFFSDLFEFGYEAVGEVRSEMEVIAEWQKPYDTGVLYYVRSGVIRGAMMCNVWDRVDEARDLIRRKAGADERLQRAIAS